MIDPFFWNDRKIGKLSRDERSLIVGCVGQADDDGRLQADSSFLKAAIYKYDDDLDSTAVKELRDNCLSEMEAWPSTHPYRMVIYHSSEEEYIFFPNWNATNRPSHPSKSQLPSPPPESLPLFSGESPEVIQSPSVDTHESVESPSVLGQVSQVKVSIGQGSAVREDFSKYFNNNSDLTDFLTKTLTNYMSSGRAAVQRAPPGIEQASPEKEAARAAQWGMPVLEKFWQQAVGGNLPGTIWQGAYNALQKFPVEVVAIAFIKAGRYQGGKHKSWKYIQTIIEEEMAKKGQA